MTWTEKQPKQYLSNDQGSGRAVRLQGPALVHQFVVGILRGRGSVAVLGLGVMAWARCSPGAAALAAPGCGDRTLGLVWVLWLPLFSSQG